MIRNACVLGAALALAAIAPAADAATHHVHHGHKHVAGHAHHGHYLHRGYARRGPPYGYKFGFATYAGDPFYGDDYYDGRSCFYRFHHDFCEDVHPREWLH